MKSLEQRLFEAWRNSKGLRLSPEDVDLLTDDDAIATRISNVAAEEAGVEDPGEDCLRPRQETWHQFKKRLQGETEQ